MKKKKKKSSTCLKEQWLEILPKPPCHQLSLWLQAAEDRGQSRARPPRCFPSPPCPAGRCWPSGAALQESAPSPWQHMKSPGHRMCLCTLSWGKRGEGQERGRELNYSLHCQVYFQHFFFFFSPKELRLFISPFSRSDLGDLFCLLQQ